LKALCY